MTNYGLERTDRMRRALPMDQLCRLDHFGHNSMWMGCQLLVLHGCMVAVAVAMAIFELALWLPARIGKCTSFSVALTNVLQLLQFGQSNGQDGNEVEVVAVGVAAAVGLGESC